MFKQNMPYQDAYWTYYKNLSNTIKPSFSTPTYSFLGLNSDQQHDSASLGHKDSTFTIYTTRRSWKHQNRFILDHNILDRILSKHGF